MNAVYLKPAVMVVFLEILYIAYISSFPSPNASESIPNGLLMENYLEKHPKKLISIKYELTCALRGAAGRHQTDQS